MALREQHNLLLCIYFYVPLFTPVCTFSFHDLMCISAVLSNRKSDKNRCAVHSFLFKFSKSCFNLESVHFHHSFCHILNSFSPHVMVHWISVMHNLVKMLGLIIHFITFIFKWCLCMVLLQLHICMEASIQVHHSLMTQIEKIFRFYVLYSRELNFSLCHMVCSSARDMQANEETNKLFSLQYPSRKWSHKSSLGSSLRVISSLEKLCV